MMKTHSKDRSMTDESIQLFLKSFMLAVAEGGMDDACMETSACAERICQKVQVTPRNAVIWSQRLAAAWDMEWCM